MTDVLLLSRSDLEKTLDFPSVIEVLEQAFLAEERGQWNTPKRIAAHTKGGGLLAMPCGGGSPEALGAKLVSTFSGNSRLGRPGVSGLYALFDPENGAPIAVMDGAYLTLVRTAGVSAVATKLMARQDARSLGVLGAGAQAEIHVRLLASIRPIDRVVVWARRRDAAESAIARLRSREDLPRIASWTVAETAEAACACDVVVTATASTMPVLQADWLSEASHINAIGAHTPTTRELDTGAVTEASVLAVESAETLREAGDLQMAESEAGGVVSRVATLGGLIAVGAARPEGRSVFKSCGIAFEDLAVASIAFQRARSLKLGSSFSFA